MVNSQNGWPGNNRSLVKSWTIPGTTRNVTLEKGNAGWLLCDFAAWFDKNIEDIEAGQLDDWGYAERPIRGSTALSNHASGTAIDLNSTKHPLAKVGTFTPAQAAKIRERLKHYEGVIRWGGDYSGRKDEMHFEINRSPAVVAALVKKLQANPAKVSFLMALTDAQQTELLNNVAWLVKEVTKLKAGQALPARSQNARVKSDDQYGHTINAEAEAADARKNTEEILSIVRALTA